MGCPESTSRLQDASIVPLFKNIDRKDCRNYRGISLLAAVGKILSRVLLNRLNKHISQNVLPETQCGFRSGRSTMDMVFCLRQVQEKCIEQNILLYVVFIDFSKIFDTVSQQGLWQVLKKYGCTEKFVNLTEALHLGMQANVTVSGSVSKNFSASSGWNKVVCWRLHSSRSIWQPCLRWPSKTLQKEYIFKQGKM